MDAKSTELSQNLKEVILVLFDSNYDLKDDRDDTIFEKFLTALGNEVMDSSKFELFSNLTDDDDIRKIFHKFFVEDDNVEDTQRAYTLQIISQLMFNGKNFEKFNSTFPFVFDWIHSYIKQRMINSSIALSILSVHRSILNSDSCLEWIISSGSVEFYMDHLKSKCLFVRKASKELLIKVITLISKNYPKYDYIVDLALERLFKSIGNESSIYIAILTISQTCHAVPKLYEVFDKKFDVIPVLIELLSSSDSSCLVNHIAIFLANVANTNSNMSMSEQILSKILSDKQYASACIFASEAIKNCANTTLMMGAIQNPVQLMFSSASKDDCFDNLSLSEVRKLICNCLKCLTDLCSCQPSPIQYFQYDLILSIMASFNNNEYSSYFKGDRVLVSCLEFFSKYHENGLKFDANNYESMISICLKSIKATSFNCSLLIKCINWLKILLNIAPKRLDAFDLEPSIENTISRHLLDTRWEVQDSVIELLHTLVSGKNPFVHDWLVLQKFHVTLYDILMSDLPNAYVIASSLKFVSELLKFEIFDVALSRIDPLFVDKYYERNSNLLLHSSDYIIRRAAASILASRSFDDLDCFYKDNKLLLLMIIVCQLDLDWTVKLSTLEFWEKLMDKAFNQHLDESKILQILAKNGFISSVLSALYDHEISVQRCACSILKKLQERLKVEVVENNSNIILMPSKVKSSSIPLDFCDKANRDKAIDDVLDTAECDRVAALLKDECDTEMVYVSLDDANIREYTADDLLKVLKSNCFDKQSKIYAESTDTYNGNFNALILDLKDCIICVDKNRSENAADCY